jgi:plastocyanin
MRRNLVGAAMGVVAAGAVLTACGGGSSGGSAAADTGTAAPSSSADGPGAQTVEVTATEYEFGLATTHFAPGTYTFVMRDDGHASHAITIDGPGVDNKTSRTSGPGGTAALTVTLGNGDYVLYCPVGNHRALGMQTNLTVG